MARRENRTVSELMREAFRRHKREREWSEANAYGRLKAEKLGVTRADVVRLIKEHRAEGAAHKDAGKRRRKTGS